MKFVVLMTDCEASESWETGEVPDGSDKETILKMVFGDPDKIGFADVSEPREWRRKNGIVLGLHGGGLPDGVRILELGQLAITLEECEAFNRKVEARLREVEIAKAIDDKDGIDRLEYERLKRKFEPKGY